LSVVTPPRSATVENLHRRSKTPKGPIGFGPFWIRGLIWLRGLDLNQRPLGYEHKTAMPGNPLIFREKHSTARSSTFSVDALFLLLFRPVSCHGSKMGAGRVRCVRPCQRQQFVVRHAFPDFSTLPRDARLLSAMSAPLVVTREAPDAPDDGDGLLVRGNSSPARVVRRERCHIKPPRQRRLSHAPCASDAR